MSELTPQAVLDEISSRLSIVDLISEYIPLKKAGKNYKACCPFHSEKSPSFSVSSDKNLYYCFGCGEGGNIFTFVTKFEKIPFGEALEKLAKKAGVTLKKTSSADRDEREILYKVNRYAAWFFAQNLKEKGGKLCRNYLQKRDLNEQTIETFQLGYALDSWDGLVKFLQSKKVPLELAVKLGLVRSKDGRYYDFYRHRLIFPIIDDEGRVIGFGGRRLDDTRVQEAKYINSPESPIYYKGNNLYGLYQAKSEIRAQNRVVLVEGYMDLIRLSQAGIKNVVAPLGTALTEAQVKMLKRFAEAFVLMFDGDSAGLKAALRGIPIFFAAGFHPYVVELPAGEDPDTFIAKFGMEAMQDKIKVAPLAMEWLMVKKFKEASSKPSQKIDVAKYLTSFINFIPSQIEREAYLAKLAEFLGITRPQLMGSLKLKSSDQVPERDSGPFKISLERILLGLYVREPEFADAHLSDDDLKSFEDESLGKLGILIKNEFAKSGRIDLEKLKEEGCLTEELFAQLFLIADEYGETGRQYFMDCLKRFREKTLKNELRLITGEIRVAEMEADQESLKKLLGRQKAILENLQIRK